MVTKFRKEGKHKILVINNKRVINGVGKVNLKRKYSWVETVGMRNSQVCLFDFCGVFFV